MQYFGILYAHTVHVICSPENENVRAATHNMFRNFKWGGFHWMKVYCPFCPCSCSPENKGFALKTHDIVRLMKQIFLNIQFLEIDMMFSFIEATRLFFYAQQFIFICFICILCLNLPDWNLFWVSIEYRVFRTLCLFGFFNWYYFLHWILASFEWVSIEVGIF